MSKFYEVSKVLDKRTDLGCVSFRGATTSIVRRASVTMPMDTETFKELFGGLPLNFNIPRAQVLPNSYRALNQAQRSLCTHGRACIS